MAQSAVVEGSRTSVASPDGNLVVRFYQEQSPGGAKTMYYTVAYKGRTVIAPSALDIQLDNHLSEEAMALPVDTAAGWCTDLVIRRILSSSHDTTWTPVCGEKARIADHYNAVTIETVKAHNPIYAMNVEIRASDEGAALRYFFPENPKGSYYHITGEHTEFALPAGTRAWVAHWAQGPYRLLPLAHWPDESERPLTLELPDGTWACLAEAGQTDYARTKFTLSNEKPNTIVTSMYGAADPVSPFGTPWRVILLADRPGDLIEHNDLLLNLNAPGQIRDTRWIRPGKIMRVMTLTTQDAFENIDFAAAHHLQYVLFDWKWYGPAFTFSSDATTVGIPNFDLPRIIAYGRKKGIGVWLYVNQQALLKQRDSLFAVYRKWGVKGVKFGFVEAGSHRWTTWLEKAIRQAAASHIMVNIHDDWRPTGEERTWPNLMTAEGVRGNEEMPDATHNTVLPFTRFIAGPADYTICYYDRRIKTTHAHQLALAAVYYSPIQTLFWYDKPSAYHGEPEISWFEKIPTTWDETKVLAGIPGEYITTARRKGSDWFLGTITNDSARTLSLPLDFLPKGKKYTATIYKDDPSVKTATHIKIGTRVVDANTVLEQKLLPSGGEAIRLEEKK